MLKEQEQRSQMMEASLRARQDELNAQLAQKDKDVQAQVQAQFADAQQQTKKGQAAAQLGIIDAIKTSPSGLKNTPKTGKLTLLGN